MTDITDEMLDKMSDNRKAFLARVVQRVDPQNNIYKDSLVKQDRFDLLSQYKIEVGSMTRTGVVHLHKIRTDRVCLHLKSSLIHQ